MERNDNLLFGKKEKRREKRDERTKRDSLSLDPQLMQGSINLPKIKRKMTLYPFKSNY